MLLEEAKKKSEDIERESVLIKLPEQNYRTMKAGEDITQTFYR